MPIARSSDCSLRARFDHADHWNRKRFFQLRQRHGRGRVARDHDSLHVLSEKHVGHFDAVALDRARALAAVWNTCGIAEIENVLRRQ